MSEKVFKKLRVVGCSDESYKKAIENAIAKTNESVHGVSWFEVAELRGAIQDGKVTEWQATVDIGFKVD